jgi:hypothetical protein
MEETVEDGEVGEEVFVEHAFEIEFDETLSDKPGGVAQEPHGAAVGDNAVKVFGEVEIFLQERVRGHARAGPVVAPFVEGVVPAEQMQRQAVAILVAVGDGKELAVDVLAFAGKDGCVAEQREQRDEPEIAGF